MSSIRNEQFDLGFIARTLENLSADNAVPNEVTMLLNSLLGLVIIPAEYREKRKITAFNKLIVDVPVIKELMKDSYFYPTRYDYDNKQYKQKLTTVSNLLTSIRNSVAHQQIECIEEEGKWRYIKLSDVNKRNAKNNLPHLELSVTWSIVQLREFCKFVCQTYLQEVAKKSSSLSPIQVWRSDELHC